MLFEFLLGLALMFLGIGVTNMASSLGESGTIASLLLGSILLVVAFNWQTIEPNLSTPLRASIADAASNGYVWLAMLALVWAYLAANSLIIGSRGKPLEVLWGANGHVPDSIAERDKEHLKNKLMRQDKDRERKSDNLQPS
jgi:hypothetical protein